MSRRRSRIHAVDGSEIAGGAIDEQDGRTDLFCHIFGNDAWCIPADQSILGTQYSSMDRVVGDKRKRFAILLIDSYQSYPAVSRSVRIKAKRRLSIYIHSAAIDISLRKTPSHSQPGGYQF